MKQLSIIVITGFAVFLSVFNSSCYYDKEEILYPATVCDSATVQYSSSIVPILSSNCYSCHGGNTPSAGVRLDSYAGVQAQAANGKLLGAVSHNTGFSPMPKNTNKLSACNVAKIKKWILAGYPNN